MGLFFNKKYSIDDIGKTNKQVLLICLELILNTDDIGKNYKGLDKAVESGKLTKKEMKKCISLVIMFRDLVISQPELANSFGNLTFEGTIKILKAIKSYFEKKI